MVNYLLSYITLGVLKPLNQGESVFETLIYYMFILLILFFIISMFFSMTRRKPVMTMKTLKTITVLRCENCDYREEREFQIGDYIFKKIGECAKCKGPLYIAMIYGIPEKPA